MKITLFKNAKDTKNPKFVELDYVLDGIRTCKIQKQIDELRNGIKNGIDEGEQKKMKTMLPSIIFGGTFKERTDAGIIDHSGLAILDFDHLDDPIDKKVELSHCPFIYAAFISPSGTGVKALAKIPKGIDTHRDYYRGIMKVFPELDSTSINPSRVCFMSADKDIYINKNAVEFTDKITVESAPQPVAVVKQSEGGTNYRKIAIATDMIKLCGDKEKHHTLLKASKLMGGYIATGAVEEYEAIRCLEHAISLRDIVDFDAAKETIRKGIEHGKGLPIYEIEKEIFLSPSASAVRDIDSVWEEMKYTFKHGKKRGETTHFPAFDENFKWKKGDVTLIIGRPNVGKSEFALHLMMIKSVKCGWRWGVFCPENYPEDEFYDTIIHSYIGKTTDPYYGDRQMSIEEYEQGYKFVREHFFYVYPERHTIEEIDSAMMYLIQEKNITGIFLDPFNQIEADYGSRQDLFLSTFLTERKRFALKHELNYVISSHPKSMTRNKNGEYEIPDMYDIAGGAMWGNKVDNIMVLHRPNFISNPADPTVEVHVKKIKKQKLVGIPGMRTFTFDRKSNRYFIDDYSPLEIKKPNLTPLKNFYEPTEKAPF